MDDRIWQGNQLTSEVVRAWGYDAGLLLMTQDEDLLLHDSRYFPVLLELSADERCPKQDYAFSILCQFCRELATRHGAQGSAELRTAWLAPTLPAGDLPTEWHDYVGRLLSYTEPSGPKDRPAARRMAKELLLGIAGRVGKVIESDSILPGWFRFTLRTSISEHVDVCETTGAFKYTRA